MEKQVKILPIILFSIISLFGNAQADLNADPAVIAKEKKPGVCVKEKVNTSSKTMKVLPVTRGKLEKNKEYYVSDDILGGLNLKVLTMEASAYYSPKKGQKKYVKSYHEDMQMNGGGLTSSGTVPTEKTVAAGRFKAGTILLILGVGFREVEDTGEAIVGNKIDLYTGQGDRGRELAMELGRRPVRVIVISEA